VLLHFFFLLYFLPVSFISQGKEKGGHDQMEQEAYQLFNDQLQSQHLLESLKVLLRKPVEHHFRVLLSFERKIPAHKSAKYVVQ